MTAKTVLALNSNHRIDLFSMHIDIKTANSKLFIQNVLHREKIRYQFWYPLVGRQKILVMSYFRQGDTSCIFGINRKIYKTMKIF
jgi:hypothetical protein